MGKKGPLWWRESDWLLRGSSAANQILLRHSGPILSIRAQNTAKKLQLDKQLSSTAHNNKNIKHCGVYTET